MKLRVLVHPAEEGGYWAEIPALSGCVSEGETYEETMANILEAAEGWLAVAIEQLPTEDKVQIAEIELWTLFPASIYAKSLKAGAGN
jgi:predicted RNase H-like HicB family nuclease